MSFYMLKLIRMILLSTISFPLFGGIVTPSKVIQNVFENKVYYCVDSLSNKNILSIKDTDFDLRVIPPFHNPEKGTIWVKFFVKNTWNENLVFVHGDPHVENINIYFKDKDAVSFDSIVYSKNAQYYERQYHTPVFAVDLPVLKGKTVVVVLKYLSNHAFYNFAWVESSSSFFNSNYNFFFDYKFYCGIILVLFFYSMLMYLFTKQALYLYYLFYIFSSLFLYLTRHGLDFKFIWFNYPALVRLSPTVFTTFFAISHLFYIKMFLNKLSPFYYYFKIVSYAMVAMFLSFFVVDCVFLLPFFYTMNYLLFPAIFSLIFTVIDFVRYRKISLYVLVATSITFLALCFEIFRGNGWVSFNPLIDPFVLEYALIIDMLLFLTATVVYFRRLRDDSQQLNAQLLVWLNKQTQSSTISASSNQFGPELNTGVLQEAIFETEAIKTENNEFKKTFSDIKEQLVLEKEVEFPHFQLFFPDENLSLKFLGDLKWAGKYACRRCGNTDWKKGASEHDRKCNKCFYNESAKVGTLYEGTKFPMVKAFYLTYFYANHANEKINLANISDVLNLRKGTVSEFLTKIQQYQKPKKKYQTWVDYIL